MIAFSVQVQQSVVVLPVLPTPLTILFFEWIFYDDLTVKEQMVSFLNILF